MPKSVYIVVFAISTLAAYWWGVNGKPMLSRHQERTSTAVVHLRDAAPAVSLDPDSIRRQVLSPENFSERMWQAATAARLREKLAVEVAADDAPDATRIAMSYADEDPRTAAGWVNDLANAFAQRYRQQWHARAEKVYQEAHAAAAAADDQLRQASARLDAALDEQWKRSRQNPSPVPAATPSLVDNPDWVALSRQVGDLQQRRAKLLVDRTPLHPEVRQTELRLAELQGRLAETPRWIPGRQPGVVSAPPLTPAGDRQMAAPVAAQPDSVASLNKLRESAAAARRASQQAAVAERDAWKSRQREPRIELQLAVVQAAPASLPLPLPLRQRLRLALAALAAGLTTTVGIGMIATGAAIEPTVNSLAQVSAILTVPVVGVVPATSPAKPGRSLRSNALRRLWIAAGLLAIACCAAILLWGGR